MIPIMHDMTNGALPLAHRQWQFVQLMLTARTGLTAGVEARSNNQRAAFPLSSRVSEPGRVGIFRMRPSIHEDLPVAVDVAFKQEKDVARSLVCRGLDHPPGIW